MIRRDGKQWFSLLAFAGSAAWVLLYCTILQRLNELRATTYQVYGTAYWTVILLMPLALGLALGALGRRSRLYITPAHLVIAVLCLLPTLLYIGTIFGWPGFPTELSWMPHCMMNMSPSTWGFWSCFAAGFCLSRGLLAPTVRV